MLEQIRFSHFFPDFFTLSILLSGGRAASSGFFTPLPLAHATTRPPQSNIFEGKMRLKPHLLSCTSKAQLSLDPCANVSSTAVPTKSVMDTRAGWVGMSKGKSFRKAMTLVVPAHEQTRPRVESGRKSYSMVEVPWELICGRTRSLTLASSSQQRKKGNERVLRSLTFGNSTTELTDVLRSCQHV
jgi:hypothetical protein